tara:strand:- start:100 stop:684 length:585 start_codon:yes stop_codon:yes gene_type:complete
MAFWSANSTEGNSLLEPKRSFRWLGYVNLNSSGLNDIPQTDLGPATFLVSSFTKPKLKFDADIILGNFTSETSNIIKNYMWEDIQIRMVDVESEVYNASSNIYRWLLSLGYEPNQTVTNLGKLFQNLHKADTMTITLEHINAEGKSFERWSLIDAQPTNIDFGEELNYENSSVMYVTMGVQYVSAEYEKLNPTD